jgi:hypothetical protein
MQEQKRSSSLAPANFLPYPITLFFLLSVSIMVSAMVKCLPALTQGLYQGTVNNSQSAFAHAHTTDDLSGFMGDLAPSIVANYIIESSHFPRGLPWPLQLPD